MAACLSACLPACLSVRPSVPHGIPAIFAGVWCLGRGDAALFGMMGKPEPASLLLIDIGALRWDVGPAGASVEVGKEGGAYMGRGIVSGGSSWGMILWQCMMNSLLFGVHLQEPVCSAGSSERCGRRANVWGADSATAECPSAPCILGVTQSILWQY